jgi:hypothetical protein
MVAGSWGKFSTCPAKHGQVENLPHDPVTRKAPILNQAEISHDGATQMPMHEVVG